MGNLPTQMEYNGDIVGDNGDNGIELTMIIGDKPHMNYPVREGS